MGNILVTMKEIKNMSYDGISELFEIQFKSGAKCALYWLEKGKTQEQVIEIMALKDE